MNSVAPMCDMNVTNDSSLLKLQLAGAQNREMLALQALNHVRQLSNQLSESLAREARLSAEISELHKTVQTLSAPQSSLSNVSAAHHGSTTLLVALSSNRALL